MPKMRAKMNLSLIEQHVGADVLHFNAVAAAKYPDDGSDEDNTFAKFSPAATVKLHVANPALIGQFKVGEKYYVDFTPVE